MASDFQFAAMYAHSRSGLNLTQFRSYSSNLGRWSSPDPLVEIGDPNLYDYVSNTPITQWDELGLTERGNRIAQAAQKLYEKAMKPNSPEHRKLKSPPAKCNVFVGMVLSNAGTPVAGEGAASPTVKQLKNLLGDSDYFERVPYDPYDVQPGDIWLWVDAKNSAGRRFADHSGVVDPQGSNLLYAGGGEQTFEGIGNHPVGGWTLPPNAVYRAL